MADRALKAKDTIQPIFWICHDCGIKHGTRVPRDATYHHGRCDVCEKATTVTQGRDYECHMVLKKDIRDDFEIMHGIGKEPKGVDLVMRRKKLGG